MSGSSATASTAAAPGTDKDKSTAPMDLAPRGPSVVQLRPVPRFSAVPGVKGPTTVTVTPGPGTPIISVNRSLPGNALTLLPAGARPVIQASTTQAIPTYHITRVANVRPGTNAHQQQQQPASITVTPLPASNIRLTGATVNNGTWIQTSGAPAGFSPIRGATITVGTARQIRPDGKQMIHIPQHHVAHVHLPDGKSILKPQITTTPIVNIRGTLPGGANSLPIQSAFTIRTANITNISTIQRPPTSSSTSAANQVHKVIAQPAHATPIQILNSGKSPQVIQAITPLPKLSTVCLTLSTNASIAPSNSSPVVAVAASRQPTTPSLIMTPSTNSPATLPMKVYPVAPTPNSNVRDVESVSQPAPFPIVQSGTVSVSAVTVTSSPASVVVTQPPAHQHVLVAHATPTTINVQPAGLPPPNLATGSIAPGYIVDKGFPVNLVSQQARAIALDKKGPMIFATTNPHNAVTIPIANSNAGTTLQIAQLSHPVSVIGTTPTITVTPNPNVGQQLTASVLTVTTTTISSTAASITNVVSTVSTVSTTACLSATSVAPSSTVTVNTSNSSSLTAAPPAHSPNQNPSTSTNSSTKTTHSPRPSILRKRDLGDHHSVNTSRAQRNLSHQLNFSSNPCPPNTGSNKENTNTSIPSAITIEKLPPVNSSNSSISILKKEFQPPNEESSWQSVSSNSSSGSSTISTTSETAELQMQQQLSLNLSSTFQQSQPTAQDTTSFVDLGSSTKGTFSSSGLSSSTSHLNNSNNRTDNSHQNGVLRTTQPGSRSRSSSTSKGTNKDVDKVKNKDKDLDAVSPRKKPRKQQLTTSDLLEAASPEIYYQGKGKRFKKGDLKGLPEGLKGGLEVHHNHQPAAVQEPPTPRVVYHVIKPHISLMKSNSVPPKPLTTHFQRYSDVKSKEEKRPTVAEMANQKGIFEKVNGWRVNHMAVQMKEVVEGESLVVKRYSNLMDRLESNCSSIMGDRDLINVLELYKGNIQRCKVIRDQMSESKGQALKILEHNKHVLEVINKYSNKRTHPTKKKERYV